MNRHDRDYDRDYNDRYNDRRRNQHSDNWQQDSDSREKLSNYQSRYESRGNYYGMPQQDSTYRNVKASERADFGNNSAGPVGGYGASSWQGSSNRQENQGSRNQQYGSNRSYNGDRDRQNYNQGSSRGSGGGYSGNSSYGSQSNYASAGGYEPDRGVHADNTSGRNRNTYSREDNYKYTSDQGEGFRQQRKQGLEQSLDDRYVDRGEHSRSSSDNDYGRNMGERQHSSSDHEWGSGSYRNQQNNRNSGNRDNYATGSYSSNRAYLADHGQDRDEDIFDRRSDEMPNRSNSERDRNQRSGPDYSASSPISDYGRNNNRSNAK